MLSVFLGEIILTHFYDKQKNQPSEKIRTYCFSSESDCILCYENIHIFRKFSKSTVFRTNDSYKFIRDELTLCVERLKEDDAKLYEASLNIMREKIRSSTSSLTSVPKPLKFLRNHFDSLKEVHTKLSKLDFKIRFFENIRIRKLSKSKHFSK